VVLIAEAADDPSRVQSDTNPFTHPDSPDRLPADRVYDVPLAGEPPADVGTVFVVCRLGYRSTSTQFPLFAGWEFDQYPTGEKRWTESDPDYDVFPSRYPVCRPRLVPEAAFATRANADADAVERERAARRLLNPYLTYDYARSVGGSDRSATAWAAEVGNAPDADFDKAWSVFAATRMCEVVEVPWEG
jgi:hypothetical protein